MLQTNGMFSFAEIKENQPGQNKKQKTMLSFTT